MDELNRDLAELCGWTWEEEGFRNYSWMALRSSGGNRWEPFTESIDSQKAPGGPEEIARARGWEWNVCEIAGDWYAELEQGDTDEGTYRYHVALAPTEAEARARALRDALREATDA